MKNDYEMCEVGTILEPIDPLFDVEVFVSWRDYGYITVTPDTKFLTLKEFSRRLLGRGARVGPMETVHISCLVNGSVVEGFVDIRFLREVT